MTTTSSSASVLIFGIESSDFGCSCEHHTTCGCNIDIDAIVRLKKTCVKSRKFLVFLKDFLTYSHRCHVFLCHSTGNDSYATIIAAIWVSEGVDRCIIGRVNPAALSHSDRLEGRICQVVEFFSHSQNPSKSSFSDEHGGVLLAQVVDRYLPGDDALNQFVEGFDDDDD